MKKANARWIAFQILLKLENHQSNSSILLQKALSKIVDAKERHLITDLVLGTLRWRGWLLYLIESFSKRSLRRLDPEVILISQIGLYQLLYTSIPQHAVLYETVDLCKRAKLSSAASFVNGLLRSVQSSLSSLPEPLASDMATLLAARWSHPEWLVKRWLERFGEKETIALLQTNNESPPLYVRINELQMRNQMVTYLLLEEGVRVQASEFGENLLQVTEGSPQFTHSFEEGDFYIQDAGIEVLGQTINPLAGTKILEIAAAPGGKTFHMAVCMQDQGLIVAVDSDIKRMQLWRRNMKRLRIHAAVPVVADARALPFRQTFDQVVVDAPCSSLGVIRRHPEIRWWRKEGELAAFALLQLQILNSCAKYVRDQGELVYSVCSFEPEETLQVSEKFLAAQDKFTIENHLYLYPHRNQTDGFFIAKFKKEKNHEDTKNTKNHE